MLFRTRTVPDGATHRGVISVIGDRLRTPRDHTRTVQSDIAKASPQLVHPISASQVTTPRPVQLVLPVPARSAEGGVADCSWSIRPCLDEDATVFPPMIPMAPQPQQVSSARKSTRPLPSRLQRLDDQTVMPREVYDRMLQQGDLARGSLGYGQHRLTFQGPEGRPVLKVMPTR